MYNIITQSAARSFRGCQRSYQYRYELGYRPTATTAPLAFGKLMHAALAAWSDVDPEFRLAEALSAIDKSDSEPLDKLIAGELMRGYTARWIDEQIGYPAAEISFETALVNPVSGRESRTWRLAGKLDAIISRSNGVWIMERKTSGQSIEPGSVYWQKLQLDTQISSYLVGAESLGYKPLGCVYDVIGKPRMRQLKATPVEDRKYTKAGSLYANQRAEDESLEDFRARLRDDIAGNPDRYYQRGEVFRTAAENREAACDLWQIAHNIRDCQLSDTWPRNPDSCWKYERACDYWPVCIGECSLEDSIRYRKAETPHEELKEE
jgi:hypothetical protein